MISVLIVGHVLLIGFLAGGAAMIFQNRNDLSEGLITMTEKPISFAEYLGMPESVGNNYIVDDSGDEEDHLQRLMYMSDYERAVMDQQAAWAHRADWELELLYEPSDAERADIEWARDWWEDIRALNIRQWVGYPVV